MAEKERKKKRYTAKEGKKKGRMAERREENKTFYSQSEKKRR